MCIICSACTVFVWQMQYSLCIDSQDGFLRTKMIVLLVSVGTVTVVYILYSQFLSNSFSLHTEFAFMTCEVETFFLVRRQVTLPLRQLSWVLFSLYGKG